MCLTCPSKMTHAPSSVPVTLTGHAGPTHLHMLTQVNATVHVGGGNPTDVRKGSTCPQEAMAVCS